MFGNDYVGFLITASENGHLMSMASIWIIFACGVAKC